MDFLFQQFRFSPSYFSFHLICIVPCPSVQALKSDLSKWAQALTSATRLSCSACTTWRRRRWRGLIWVSGSGWSGQLCWSWMPCPFGSCWGIRMMVDDGWMRLDDDWIGLDDGWMRLDDGWMMFDDGRLWLDDCRWLLDEIRWWLDDGRWWLNWIRLADGWMRLDDGWMMLDDGWMRSDDLRWWLDDAR